MNTEVEHTRLAGVPLLLVRPVAARGSLPTVLWFHGLAADKEVHLPELHRFAATGLLAVGVDAVGHGERRLADFEQQFARSPEDCLPLFKSLVAHTVAEVPALIDALIAGGLADGRRIAVAGVSMGGCIVYGAVPSDRRLCAAVALMGSPERTQPGPHTLADERFFPTALLSITAERDSIVPPAAAEALHERLAPRYASAPDRLCQQTIAGAPHFMSVEDWECAVAEACTWLARFVL
ncbi:MAG: alpha/beta fold hydrolase [Candidatus Accumulibacter phosphatis]|uniref:dienelactone hydrolase family protein n=1 Tax=Candidatus Accumulibacter phosphatis TaxID=327160 RepID=UPI001A4AEC72|nr:alpha/beta fold hydrolase [Candidatus Accumulibacter phosphatis]